MSPLSNRQEPPRAGAARFLRWTLGCLVVGMLVVGSRLPVRMGDPSGSEIVFSWRYHGEVRQECRPYTAAELERLPAHMRGQGVCERGIPARHLRVSIDDSVFLDRVVNAKGRSEDRPIAILERVRTRPGVHRVRVEFTAVDEGIEPSAVAGVIETPDGSGRPAPLDRDVELAAGETVLVTLADDESGFELRWGPGRGG